MKKRLWYKLDNVGKFYSFTNTNKIPTIFRYSVSLTEVVDFDILQQALNATLEYYPRFNCHLKRGLFWRYLEASDKGVKVSLEDKLICSKIHRDDDDILFRVNYYKKRINFEVSHILTDGRGSLTFFKCLVYKYLILKHNLKNIEIDSDSSENEKNEDSFDKHYTKEKLSLPKNGKVYEYKGKKKETITFFEYHISVKEALELAHSYNVSLTSLMLAVLICSYQTKMKEVEYNQIVKIDVPVDLRQFFNSVTSGNFFGVTSVSYQFMSKDYLFNDVVKSVDKQLKSNTSIEQLKIRMNQMMMLEKSAFTRFVPIYIKDVVLKCIDLFSTASCTSCLSNIGKIKVDEKLEKYIDNFNVLATTGSLKVTMCSFNDDLSIGISSRYLNNDIVKNFCRFFKNRNIKGVINTNEEDV